MHRLITIESRTTPPPADAETVKQQHIQIRRSTVYLIYLSLIQLKNYQKKPFSKKKKKSTQVYKVKLTYKGVLEVLSVLYKYYQKLRTYFCLIEKTSRLCSQSSLHFNNIHILFSNNILNSNNGILKSNNYSMINSV